MNKDEQEISNLIETLSKDISEKDYDTNVLNEDESILLKIFLERHEETTNKLL